MSIETFGESIFPLWLYFIYLLPRILWAPAASSFILRAACISALRAKDIIHCPLRRLYMVPLLYFSLWGPLESARADNNSYMSQQVAIPGSF